MTSISLTHSSLNFTVTLNSFLLLSQSRNLITIYKTTAERTGSREVLKWRLFGGAQPHKKA
jgi:hypothetical protein